MRCRLDSTNHREFEQVGQKERGARQPHKRLLYCVNVNRTSPDHLLLGRNADVDKNVEWSDFNSGLRERS
jgi:hypothetical protein